MMLSDLQYRNVSSSSLSVGSVLSGDDLKFFTDGSSSLNFPFGQSPKDFVKLGIYGADETYLTSSLVTAGGVYSAHTHSYFDVATRLVTATYSSFASDWVVVGQETQSLFLDISKQMQALGMADGNYVVTLELLRNMVGAETASNDQLLVNTISPNRDEVSLIPKFLASTVSEAMTDYTVFSNNQFRAREVAQPILDAIASPALYSAFYTASAMNPSGSKSLKFNYGFTTRVSAADTGSVQQYSAKGVNNNSDIDVVAFLTDVYTGVKKGTRRASGQYASYDILGIYDQFKNWLYTNYEVGTTFTEIRNSYYSLFRYIIDAELGKITNKRPDDYEEIVNFLQTIYYNIVFHPPVSRIETAYETSLGGYFKNYLNLAGGLAYSILNRKTLVSPDPNFNAELVLKLDTPLPPSVKVGDSAWITNNFGFQPIVQNLYYFTAPVIKTIPLRGPNFLVKIESQGNSTEALSMEELIEETGSVYNEMVAKLNAKASASVDNTDYRYFENFINFSSATLRLSAFDWKTSQIAELQAEISDLNIKLGQNPTDQFYISERVDSNRRIDEIEASMDGYEKFLYNNSQWHVEHEASASLFDRNNLGSLINNLPQFIVEDAANNADYLTFVGMVGHFFDNLSVGAKQLTDKNNYSISPSYGVSLDVVYDMLRSLGWEAEISKDNLPLLLASFSKRDFDPDSELYAAARSFSEEERNQVIWKRLLNTLPYLYKTKGTEAGLNALITCFGIPKNIVKVREYGGIHSTHNLQDSTLYVLDEVKYEPYFSGSSEYFKLGWTGSAQTIEFNFAFDPTKTSADGETFRLVNCSGSWAVGAWRKRGQDWGSMFFSLMDGAGTTKTMITDRAPIFDGKTYHVMLRRNNLAPELGLGVLTEAQADAYPTRYDLYVQEATDNRISFAVSASAFISGSYNQNFRSGSFVYVGNYQQAVSAYDLDPEAFFGNIDEIKIWEAPVSDERYTNHTLHQNAYDLDSPYQMVAENLVRVSFERPVDLYDSSSVVTLNNLAFRRVFPTFEAVNFPPYLGSVAQITECDPPYQSVFPFQFTRKDTRQTVKLPDYGANKFRSNKINYMQQELVSNLSPTQRASMQSSELVSVDANKLGVFFSPAETQNMEIIKFFGDYPLTDLIGDPSTVYQSSYRKFEQFKQIFYDQGFGAVDYQFFMNIVRFYFDKAMLKYIKAVVPARAKLVDGILIEPSILERPKIALKPVQQETIPQKTGAVDAVHTPSAKQLPRLSATLSTRDSGISILNDVNSRMYPEDADKFGFGVFADNRGLAFYKDDYYRVDIIKVQKSYQVHNKYNLPRTALNDYETGVNLRGTVDTVTTSYYKTNLVGLPIATSYPLTMSFGTVTSSIYFSGSVSFNPITQGDGLTYQLISAHTVNGLISGSIFGLNPRQQNRNGWADIIGGGLRISGSAVFKGSGSMLYSGKFTLVGGTQLFEGRISYLSPTPLSDRYEYSASYYVDFIPTDYTSSIFEQFKTNTNYNNSLFAPLAAGLEYREEISMRNYPANATLLTGYYSNHYKYTREQFSNKTVNSYDQNNAPVKWKRNSQNKKTTVDPTSGLLDNSEPVQTKTV